MQVDLGPGLIGVSGRQGTPAAAVPVHVDKAGYDDAVAQTQIARLPGTEWRSGADGRHPSTIDLDPAGLQRSVLRDHRRRGQQHVVTPSASLTHGREILRVNGFR